ncbi:inositol monophosphatase family protein [Lentzea sp. E54]|uniref:inositol monophosphatase family protein n=1 Tax=Lentzea xerophila TaxID=3435883 RepID=UPI003DA2F611
MTGEDLGLAHRLADIADGISGGYFAGGVVETETKADGSPVTRVDREVELALRDAVARERPHEGFLGEEFGPRGPAERRWIVDALDGTASFVAGEPEWSTLIARQARGEVEMGLVSAPALDRRWYAVTGHGAWTARWSAEQQRLAVSATPELGAASVAIWPPVAALTAEMRRPLERLAAAAARVLPEPGAGGGKPSAGSGTCHWALLVAVGVVDVFLLVGGGPWDLAALVPIVEEAGGRFSDLSGGRSLEGTAGVFSNGALHDQVLEILLEHDDEEG